MHSEEDLMLDKRLVLPIVAAVSGILSFTTLGLLVNGVYAVAHAIAGKSYEWGFWSMWCDRTMFPALRGVTPIVNLLLGVLGYRLLRSIRPGDRGGGKTLSGFALLMM